MTDRKLDIAIAEALGYKVKIKRGRMPCQESRCPCRLSCFNREGVGKLICDTCQKRQGDKCGVLKGDLPVWGQNCSAYTDDPGWRDEVQVAVEMYRKFKGVL